MNIKKGISGNIEQAYQNIILSNNNNNNNYKRTLQKRKTPFNPHGLKKQNYYSVNRSPGPTLYDQKKKNYPEVQIQNDINRRETKESNIEKKIHINEYLGKNNIRKKLSERIPLNYNNNQTHQNNNYYNYNKTSNTLNRNKIKDNFKSDDLKDNNLNNNRENNWKKKISHINEQKKNYQYFNNNSNNNNTNNNNNINNSYKKMISNTNTFEDQSAFSNPLSQSANINLNQTRKFHNDKFNNTLNKKFSLNNDINKKVSQDYNASNMDLSDTSFNNKTYQNYYHSNYPQFGLNDTSSSNLYDSYELNKTEYTKKLKNKFSDLSKFLSFSSKDNSSFEINKDDESYYSAAFKHPKKNDEEHYHQNLTIKIKQKNDKKKNENTNISSKGQKPAKYVDNTPKGCNVSVNTDINTIKKKKFNNLAKSKIKKNNVNINSNHSNNNIQENYNNLSNTTMFIPSKKFKNDFDLNNNNNTEIYEYNPQTNNNNNIEIYEYYPQTNNNNSQLTHNNINNNNYTQKGILSKNRLFKERSPHNYNSFNSSIYSNNNISSKNPLKKTLSLNKNININKINNNINEKNNNNIINNNMNNQVNYDNMYNKTQDKIYGHDPNINYDKKIKEITVNLSPKKKIYKIPSSINNRDLNNNKINNITPNYNYNLDSFNKNNNDDTFSFHNIKAKPKSKIESCIITFDKPKNKTINNNKKQIKLSTSLDNSKFNKLRYIKKKIPNPNIKNNNNNLYETPGMNIKIETNQDNNKFIYNKNKYKSVKKKYQEPKELYNSFKNISPKDIESNNEVMDCCAPSPDYGRRDKNISDILNSDYYNQSPLLESNNFKVFDITNKEQISPNHKYDEFSFKETNSNNVNDVNYSNSKPIKVKIINNSNDNEPILINDNSNKGEMKNIYMKKTKTCGNFNNSNNLLSSQRVPTFSNIDEILKDDNNKEDNNISNNIANKNNKGKKTNEVTPFGSSQPSKNEKLTKFTVKSFSKKKQIKEKPKIVNCFFNKYYKLYMKQPKKEQKYITKIFIKPIKKPIESNSYISKKKYNYIYKLPISSKDYYTKKKIPNAFVIPKIEIGYITKILIKNKEYIEQKLNNIENDKLVDTSKDISPLHNNTLSNINNKNKQPVKKRIILIRKNKRPNKNVSNNIINDNKKNIGVNNQINKKNENIKNISNDNNNNNNDNLSEKKEELKNINNLDNININDYLSSKQNNVNSFNSKKDNLLFKKKILDINKTTENILPDNKKFDNESSFTSDDISLNLNINKEIKKDLTNNSNNSSKLFLFQKSIDNSTNKALSNNTSINEKLNQSTSSYVNLNKATALNYSVINNNLNNSYNNDDNSSSMISNNTVNLDLDKNNIKKNTFKIKTVIRGVKKRSKHDFLKNYNPNKQLTLGEIFKNSQQSKKEIEREKKINILIKEDLENYILFYKRRGKNKDKKYNWSMLEQLIIKIKVDVMDIINGYLKACDELYTKKEYIIIMDEYIRNIIEHYRYNYLTKNNFNNIHNKLLRLLFSVKNIKIYDSIKFEILGKLLKTLLDNNIFFINDLQILKKADEKTKSNLRKVLMYFNNKKNKKIIL